VRIFVVYFNPSDFLGLYVVREGVVQDDGSTLFSPLARSGQTLDEVRQHIPHDMTRLERHPNDDPVIVETWL
jgi:phosphohistidine phosphatase SixA